MKKKYQVHGEVWKYDGPAGWYFVYVGKKESEEIKEKGGKRVGFGFVPVTATLGKTSWDTTLFPTKEGPYLLSIKAKVREKERVHEGSKVTITFILR